MGALHHLDGMAVRAPDAAAVGAERNPANFGHLSYSGSDARSTPPFIAAAFRHRWLIAVLMVAALVLAQIYTWRQTPLFRASATMEIKASSSRITEDLDLQPDTPDIRTLETARRKLLSNDLAYRVVTALNLPENPTFNAPNAGQGSHDDASRVADATATVRKDLNAQLIRNTRLLVVSYSHPDPALAAAIANQAVQSFMDQTIDARSVTSRQARDFIQGQVVAVKHKLEKSEQALVDYARDAGITLTGNDASLISQNISDVNASLARAIDEVLTLERQAIQAREGNASALPQAAESRSIQDAKSRLIELQAAYEEKGATLRPAYPEMRRLRAQIGELRSQLRREIGAVGRGVEIQFEQAKQKEAALRNVLKDLEQKQSDFHSRTIEYSILKRDVDSNRAQYDSLVTKLNDAGVGSDLKTAAATVLDEAVAPASPHSPSRALNLSIAAMLGLALSAAVVLVLELFNTKFTSAAQIESELELQVLGEIPAIRPRAEFKSQLADQQSNLSAAYRALRTSLQFMAANNGIKTLVVTSAEPDEFKTTTAFKLANDFAALGQMVLVIDADLRRPAMHKLFNLTNKMGLSNLLSNVGSAGVAGIFRPTENPRIRLLSVGANAPNPTDLLVSHRMAMTLHFCARKYDLVIIDAPPVMGLPDAPILANQADATLFVVAASKVSRKSAQQALSRLRSSGAHVVGAAMTNASVGKIDARKAYPHETDRGLGSQSIEAAPSSTEAARNEWSDGVFDHLTGEFYGDSELYQHIGRKSRNLASTT